jgi:hypothetical protein
VQRRAQAALVSLKESNLDDRSRDLPAVGRHPVGHRVGAALSSASASPTDRRRSDTDPLIGLPSEDGYRFPGYDFLLFSQAAVKTPIKESKATAKDVTLAVISGAGTGVIAKWRGFIR